MVYRVMYRQVDLKICQMELRNQFLLCISRIIELLVMDYMHVVCLSINYARFAQG